LTVAAYYLGQYHPLEENDGYWGAGFTEWHNVSRARPLYPGHRQPKLPGKFGFYDLRCKHTLAEQIETAQQWGIHAFCYWHYWFAGKRVLYGPLDSMLEMETGSFKFFLGWANESWSGVWHGAHDELLIEQSYGPSELSAHAALIAKYLDTGKFLQLDGRFPLVVYKPKQIPHAAEYLGRLKKEVSSITGAELYIIGNWYPGRSGEFENPFDYGLDAAVITPVAAYFRTSFQQNLYSGSWQVLRKMGIGPEVRPYRQVVSTLERGVESIKGVAHATIVTGWDNTPRSGRRGLVLAGYDQSTLKSAAEHAIALEMRNSNPLLFLKSWNEWAEGNVLEPLFNEEWSAGNALKGVLNGS